MNIQLRNELAEICILSIIRKEPMNGSKLISEIDKYIGIENLKHEYCFYELRRKGYCSTVVDEKSGRKMGLYCITPKGQERLEDFMKLQKSITMIYELLSESAQ